MDMKGGIKIINKIYDGIFALLFSLLDVICIYLNKGRYILRPRVGVSRFYMFIVALSIKHIYGPKKIICSKDEFIVVCLVKDAQEYVKPFVEHYNVLGAKHIVFLDNNSSDYTVRMACKYKNVTVFSTSLPYKIYAHNFKPYLKRRFSRNSWCLCVDIDEFFDYPFSDKINMKSLLNYLNERSYNAVLANMLEMFSDKPLNKLEKGKDINFKDKYRFYDLSEVTKRTIGLTIAVSNKDCKHYLDGIRKTVFGISKVGLHKYPLVFLEEGFPAHKMKEHYVVGKVRLADFSCVLFHYIFTGNFKNKCIKAIKEKSYYKDSLKYKKYFETLQHNPDLNIKEKARSPQKLHDTNELIDNGFLCISDDFIKFVMSYIKNFPG